ncbi:MAG: hypothetical protein A2808_01255 [Candidatus Moranbacteria bacterium RIFCSPHIGHO2_01_FULL_55_24]|nr:MAG: hypothetical protein A2808_01255 [Candidatus Moranbacteria bacterium RIFCSPHIGHO2_01_FULL_55_24]
MQAKALIKDFQSQIGPHIEAFFDSIAQEAVHEDSLIQEAIDHMRDVVLSGGKRLRAALMYYAYLGVGGTDREEMLRTAVSVELIHAFLLVHDDIIDRDALRHGVPTLHERYRTLAEKIFPGKDAAHFGNSIAIILGDMLYAFGNDVIFRSAFPKERVFEALSCLQKIVSYTVVGQARDVYMEYRREASQEEILRMYENKTARYSLEGPLHLGALLGGAKPEILRRFSEYAIPFGIAYQIQDDIIGIFGTEKEIGKPVGSDIQEGKITLLVSKALELGTKEERSRVKELLERHDALTEEDILEFQALIRNTGALEAAQTLANGYIEKGMQALPALQEELVPEAYTFLQALSEYMMKREH